MTSVLIDFESNRGPVDIWRGYGNQNLKVCTVDCGLLRTIIYQIRGEFYKSAYIHTNQLWMNHIHLISSQINRPQC